MMFIIVIPFYEIHKSLFEYKNNICNKLMAELTVMLKDK